MTAQPVAQVRALPHPLAAGVQAIEARVRAHSAAVTRVIDESGLARRSGASSTGPLLAQAGRIEQALADGQVSERQAKAIAGAISSLPGDVTDVQKRQCQDVLIKDAQE